MSTRTERTPTKVRANREAVQEYFKSLREEPEREVSALKPTPSGAHYKFSTKQLLYESPKYAVFDIRYNSSPSGTSTSGSSGEGSYHSLHEQESFKTRLEFDNGEEEPINTEDTIRSPGGTVQYTTVVPDQELQTQQQSSSQILPPTTEKGVQPGTLDNVDHRFLGNERMSSTTGNVSKQHYSNASELQSNEINSFQYGAKSSLRSKQSMPVDTRFMTQERETEEETFTEKSSSKQHYSNASELQNEVNSFQYGAKSSLHSRQSMPVDTRFMTQERETEEEIFTEKSSASGNVSKQHYSNASELLNEENSFRYGAKSSLHSRQSIPVDTRFMTQEKEREEEISTEISTEEIQLRKKLMDEASSSTKELNQFLYDLWQSQQMCDIIIKVNGKEFNVHKLALAAHSEKFTSRYCEEAPTTISEVILPNGNSEAAEILINYIYTNELTLTAENIESVIICARQLGIKSVLSFSQDFLNSFNEDSILFLLPIAQRQGFTDIAERMFGFISKCSSSLLESTGFMECEMHQVEWLISRDELEIKSELDVFFAVLKWIDHDRNERIKYAPILIGCVRLIYISPEDLIKHVEPERHIFNIQKCFEMLYFAFR
jgi:hypothetical protein